MAKTQQVWRDRLGRQAVRAACENADRLSVVKVKAMSRVQVNKIESGPAAALVRHTRAEAGVDQWTAFTALRVPGATWRAFEKGEQIMSAALWDRFQAWLKTRV